MADITPRMSAADYLKLVGVKKSPQSGHAKSNGKPSCTNKYGAIKTRIGDEVFDSRKESVTFTEFTLAMTANDPKERVVRLERSKKYLLIPAQVGERACRYIADFVVEFADGHVDVIDTKSIITRKNPLYVLKRKLMLERFAIRIREM